MKRIIIYIISLISIISILFFIKEKYYCTLSDIQILSIVISVITIIIIIEQYIFSRLKTYHENFIIYNNKYNELDNKLRKIINYESSGVSDENDIIDYINLCSEEYFWFKQGLIHKDVWKNWENGIKEKLQIKEIKEIFDKEKIKNKNNDSYYGFFEDDSPFS